jgi:hypothetical protein
LIDNQKIIEQFLLDEDKDCVEIIWNIFLYDFILDKNPMYIML